MGFSVIQGCIGTYIYIYTYTHRSIYIYMYRERERERREREREGREQTTIMPGETSVPGHNSFCSM